MIVSEDIYCIFDGEKYGFLAEDGDEIAPCIYDIAYPFSEGLACVCKDGKYGYIDSEGETALPFDYDRATPFVEGAAYFAIGESYGFMDKTGTPVLHFECDSISSFQEELAYYSIDGRYGYVDSKGQIAIEPQFDDAGYFQNGLAKVMKDGRYGVINRDGAFILAAEYDSVTIDGPFIITRSEGEYACFDSTGKALLEQTDRIIYSPTGEEYAYFTQEGKEGLIDIKRNILIEPLYDWISLQPLEQNLLLAEEDGLYGVVDLQGEIKIPVMYNDIEYDSYRDSAEGGMFLLTDADGNIESVDAADFSKKIPCSYDSVDWMSQDKAVVSQDGLRGIIDREGNLIEPILYFDAEPYRYNNFPESYSGFYAVWDNQLVELVTGYECGGSARGDYVCFWYDRETSQVFPGTGGAAGGFGGYEYWGTVCDRKDGEMINIASFECLTQTISNYSEEMLAHAELLYDEENIPYTKETLAQAKEEKGNIRKYSVNGVQTTIEAYQKMEDRYQRLVFIE